MIITEGDKGCSIAARDTAIRVPAFKVKQIDSTGAGDAFLAGVFAGLRLGLPWEKIGRLANAAGAVAVTRLGAFPSGFEVREEILDLYGEPIALPTPRARRGTARDRNRRLDRRSRKVFRPGARGARRAARRFEHHSHLAHRRDNSHRARTRRAGSRDRSRKARARRALCGQRLLFDRNARDFSACDRDAARQSRPGASARHRHRDIQQRQHRRIALDRDRHPRAGRATNRDHRQQGLEPRATRGPGDPCPGHQRRRRPGLAPRISVLGEVFVLAACPWH